LKDEIEIEYTEEQRNEHKVVKAQPDPFLIFTIDS
jgi:hypothetical protein